MAEQTGFGRLPGGIPILWERVDHGRTLSLGFFFATGSRYDPPGRAGTAHLVEHLVFKGTRNYSASALARLVDRVGGDLNAWTDREEMAFTCTVPAEAWPVAVEALAELCFHPTFPEDEFEREKEVIRSEILSSLEDPEELSYDAYLQGISPGDWSRPVAGTEESLGAITLDEARSWWTTLGGAERLTVAFSGNVEPALVVAALEARLAEVPAPDTRPLPPPPQFAPQSRRWMEKAPFQMVQVVAGFSFSPPQTPRQAAVWQVFSMLWGETMSSRLFQTIREQQGLCYSVTSQVFDSQGVWALQVFSACAPENVDALVTTLAAEVARLGDHPPTQEEWDDGLSALRGGVILGAERTENRVGRLWHQYQTFGEVLGVEATLALLDTPVTPEEARDVLVTLRAPSNLLVWGRAPRKKRSWGT